MPTQLTKVGQYYLQQCIELHATRKVFSGRGCLKYANMIIALSKRVGAQNALDYGCGKGNQYMPEFDKGVRLEDQLGYTVTKYDPAVPEFMAKPVHVVFDLVWCTDVMEHIPEEDVPTIVDDLNLYAEKALFVTVATHAAKKSLPNGENCHVTQRPSDWWKERFAPVTKRLGDNFVLRIE